MKPSPWLILVLLGAIGGFVFSAVSTYDFVAHLDRQVHDVHCSYIPLGSAEAGGGSDCQVTMMSPFSSVMRDSIWGGIPVSLPAMGVFAFLMFAGVWLLVTRRQHDPRATLFLALATLVPVGASIAMGYLAAQMDAACKMCIGIYASSGLALVGAIGLWITARSRRAPAEGGGAAPQAPWGLVAVAVLLGVAFTLVPAGVYAGAAPDFSEYIGACGTLPEPEDPYGVLVPIGPQGDRVPVIEVFDPLCPACRTFERRFTNLEITDQTRRRIALFPLDSECNWMVDRPLHPGACTVSEAILCAGDEAEKVLEWAFDNQEEIKSRTADDPDAAARMVRSKFPGLADCVGSAQVRARLNQALRWTVDNQLPILTPQLYVGDQRVCDEDTDLGLDFVVTRLVQETPASRPVVREPEPLPAFEPLRARDEGGAPAGGGEGAAAEGTARDGGAKAAADTAGPDGGAAPTQPAAQGATGEDTGTKKAPAGEPAAEQDSPAGLPDPDETKPSAGTATPQGAKPPADPPAPQDE